MEQHVKGASGGAMSGKDWVWLNQQGRAIAVEYPLRPIPRDIAHSAGGVILERRFASHGPGYRRIAQSLPKLETFFAAIPAHGDPAGPAPFWHNDWFPPLDAISLCALLYMYRPKRYVEIGSGNSTKFARHLISEMNLDTKIISIDPFPRAEVDRLCDTVVRQPLEELNLSFFGDLDSRDMLFIDSSHRVFQNSDVTVFFLEILPGLPDKMIYGIHDIFLPYDYPEFFVPRFYNEQYILAAYLIGGAKDEIVFPSHYLGNHPVESKPYRELGERLDLGELVLNGGAFWARKAGLGAAASTFAR